MFKLKITKKKYKPERLIQFIFMQQQKFQMLLGLAEKKRKEHENRSTYHFFLNSTTAHAQVQVFYTNGNLKLPQGLFNGHIVNITAIETNINFYEYF